MSRSNASELAGPLVSRGLQQLSCLSAQESPWLAASSLWWYYFLKGKSGIYYHFHSFALPELENLFSVYQSLFLFLFFFFLVCVFTFIAYLYLESGIFLACFMGSYI